MTKKDFHGLEPTRAHSVLRLVTPNMDQVSGLAVTIATT